jgi:hypothetical protein
MKNVQSFDLDEEGDKCYSKAHKQIIENSK